MARAVRVEFARAAYHVMARGDRQEAIVRDDMDPATFLRTLAAASVRSGFRVTRSGLMSNHCHLRLEAPQANLSLGWVGCRTRSRDGQARGMSFAVIFLGTLQRNFDRGGKLLLGAP